MSTSKILIFVTIILFSGCAVKEVNKPIPTYLTTKTVMPKPPSRELFKEADYNGRMILLKGYLKELMKAVNMGNKKIETIKEWNTSKE